MDAFKNIINLIEDQTSFVLEAGAGSGKTYTLIQTINYLLKTRSDKLRKNNQKIVCITYTNVAKNEVIERLENDPLVVVSTIHEFLWDCIKRYNKQLIIELDKLNTRFCLEKPDNGFKPNLINRITEVSYDDSGYRDFEKGQLHHDDVISLSHQMFKEYPSLTNIVVQKYPYLLIDEYQDTATETVSAVIDYLLERSKDIFLVGFYGDSYQKIYDEGIGSLQTYINTKKLTLVTKEENYRSSKKVVELLNNLRDNITQIIPKNKKPIEGSIRFINCLYPSKAKTEKVKDYETRISPLKNRNYQTVIDELLIEGWNFADESEEKIIILANSKVSARAGFGTLYKTYAVRYGMSTREKLIKREERFAKYFMGNLDKKASIERESGIEHLAILWNNKDYNGVIHYLKSYGKYRTLTKHSDKKRIENILNQLMVLRNSGSVNNVLSYCIEKEVLKPSRSLSDFLENLDIDPNELKNEDDKNKLLKEQTFYNTLMSIQYKEFVCAFKYIQEQLTYSTQHGTKGEEYKNVLMVIDDSSWKQMYNFKDFFNCSEKKPERKLRTKNLFYVSCSRAKENLVVLALSEMDNDAMNNIKEWFGENIRIIRSDQAASNSAL